MPYTKNTWVNGDPTKPLSAARLNNLETQHEKALADVASQVAAGTGSIGTALNAAIATAVDSALDGFQSAPSYLDAPYTPGSNVFPINADTSRLSIWGSSSAEMLAPYLSSALNGLGVDSVYNGGDAGAQSFHVFAALGSLPARLTFPSDTIPASGAVTVTADADFTVGVSNLKAFTGTIAGVAGTLSYTGGNLTFTRSSSGSTVPVAPGTPFIPTNGNARRADVTLLWAGKNDLSSGTTLRPLAGIIERTDRAFDWLAPLYKRALVLGHFADSNWNTTQVANLNAVNAAHVSRYGNAFVNVQAYLMSAQVWTDTGITPTSGDLAQQAAGQKPASLSSDTQHLNAAGLTAVAALIRQRLIDLGWYEDVPPPPPITSDAFSGGDVASIHNRVTDLYAGGTAKTWVGSKDGGTQDMKIASGQLSRAGMVSASGVFLLSIPMDVADYEIEFDLIALPAGFGFIVDLRRPSTSSGANGYRNTINIASGGTSSVQIQKRVSNTYSTLVSGAGTVAPGDRLKFRVKGSTVSFYLNGALQVTGTDPDASFTTGGYVGFGSAGSCVDVVIDNVVVRPV